MTSLRYWSIEEIKTANAQKGFHYFEPGTMQFFRSRALSATFAGERDIYFVTSEQFVGSDGHKNPRRYTVRAFNPETADICTVKPFNELTRYRALRIARDLAQTVGTGRTA
jgi:hypothetical protein